MAKIKDGSGPVNKRHFGELPSELGICVGSPERVKYITADSVFPGEEAEVITTLRDGRARRDLIPQLAMRVGMSEGELLKHLGLSKRSISARLANHGALTAAEQDRLYRTDRVFSRAVDVFSGTDNASIWIQMTSRALGGVTPLSMLDTEAGYELVLDTLGRIAYGIVA